MYLIPISMHLALYHAAIFTFVTDSLQVADSLKLGVEI